MKAFFVLLLFLMCAKQGNADLKPVDFALRALEAVSEHQDDFIEWFYGGAIVLEGFFRVSKVFGIDVSHFTNAYLDKYKTEPSAYGYQILHDQRIPFFRNVGDQVPLFSNVYLLRVENSTGTPGYPDDEKIGDLLIANIGAYYYVLQYPDRLSDGTPSRGYGWKTEQNSTTFLWCDDMYMGVTPLVRDAVYHKDTGPIVQAARWIQTYVRHLIDPTDGLYRHGANALDRKQSCCKWGRANGWAILAKVEVLLAMEKIAELKRLPEYRDIKQMFVSHAQAIKKFQDAEDGRWRQLVNDSSSFLETSSSAMFVSALCRGVINGWIEAADFQQSIEAGWKGLQKTLNEDGSISGVCDGEGIETEASIYKNCSTNYLKSGNGGLGTVFFAVTDYQLYLDYKSTNLHQPDIAITEEGKRLTGYNAEGKVSGVAGNEYNADGKVSGVAGNEYNAEGKVSGVAGNEYNAEWKVSGVAGNEYNAEGKVSGVAGNEYNAEGKVSGVAGNEKKGDQASEHIPRDMEEVLRFEPYSG